MSYSSHPGAICEQFFGALSMLFTLIVMIQIFRYKLYLKTFTKLIFYVAIVDFINSFPLVMGYQSNDSHGCRFQGIVSTYASLSSIFWVTTIAYLMCHLIWTGVVITKEEPTWTLIQIWNWVAPLFAALLPLSTSTYANNDDVDLQGLCFITGRTDSLKEQNVALLWQIFSFYFWVWLSMVIMMVCLCYISYKLYCVYRGKNDALRIVIKRLAWYPVIVLLCWFLPMVIDAASTRRGELPRADKRNVAPIYFIAQSCQGFLSALVFLLVNRDIVHEAETEAAHVGDFHKARLPSEQGKKIQLPGSIYSNDEDWSDNANDVDERDGDGDARGQMSRPINSEASSSSTTFHSTL